MKQIGTIIVKFRYQHIIYLLTINKFLTIWNSM